jgi:hypothetical protein
LSCRQSNYESAAIQHVTQSPYRMSYPACTRSCHVKYFENKIRS